MDSSAPSRQGSPNHQLGLVEAVAVLAAQSKPGSLLNHWSTFGEACRDSSSNCIVPRCSEANSQLPPPPFLIRSWAVLWRGGGGAEPPTLHGASRPLKGTSNPLHGASNPLPCPLSYMSLNHTTTFQLSRNTWTLLLPFFLGERAGLIFVHPPEEPWNPLKGPETLERNP